MKPSSRTRPTTRQTGYALILMVIALMGIGGVVITGFTQDVKRETEHERFLHNQRILKEAKQALLQYAYNYPIIRNLGPGRLPNADTDNDGVSNDGFTFGRLPWAQPNLNLHDIRDADGQRLWYAVSSSFIPQAPQINSSTSGTITLREQTGTVIFDGSNPAGLTQYGVAAVIIAPGALNDRNGISQDRSVANGDDPFDYTEGDNTDKDTDPGIIAASNFLDLVVGLEDNSGFTNSSPADGLILGPVNNVVNDQFIVITAAEVIAMAEKATLQTYREALKDYLDRPGFGGYPWLDPYDSDDGLATYDAQIPPVPPALIVGRVPSIFGNYFVAAPAPPNNTEPIVSEMTIKLNIDGHPVEVRAPASAVLKSYFENPTGDLVAPFNSGASFTGWVWDGSPTKTPTFLEDGWEACPYVTGTEEDCNLDSGGNFVGCCSSPMWLKVRKVTFSFSGASPFVFPFGDRVDPDPLTGVTYVPPSATSHAYVEAEYDGAYITASVAAWEEDQEFGAIFDIYPALNVGSLTYSVGDSFTVGIRYYPELPRWALTNDWHNWVQVAYSLALQPGGDGTCSAGFDDCLTLLNITGIPNNKTGLIVLSGADINGDVDLGLVDGLDDAAQAPNGDSLGIGSGAPFHFSDDLADIFEGENNNLDLIFDYRPLNSNDTVLLLE